MDQMNNQMNQMPNQPQGMPSAPSPKKHRILAPIVIVAVVVIAVLLIIGMMKNKDSANLSEQLQQIQNDIANTDAQVQALQNQGDSTEPSAIQADLNATAIDALDAQ